MGTPHSTLSTLDQLLLYIEIRFSKTYDIASDPSEPISLARQQRTTHNCGGRTLHGFHPEDGRSWHWPGLECVERKDLHLRRSSKSLCLPDFDACRRSHRSDPAVSSAATSKTLASSPSSSRTRDPRVARRSIGLWLGSQRGQNPVFEARFEAWFATHLEVALMDESLRRAEVQVKDWEVCYKSCCTLRKRLKNAYVALRIARDALEGLGAARARTMSKGRRSGALQSKSRSKSRSRSNPHNMEASAEPSVCPQSWLQNNKIHLSDGPAVLKGCAELDDLQKSILRRPVGMALSLPGIDIDSSVSLNDAIRDLRLMTTFDFQSQALQEHVQSLRYFMDLVRSREEMIQQAFLDTEVVISMLVALIKASGREEELLKLAFEKTMPDLWERWWMQVRNLQEAARFSGGTKGQSVTGDAQDEEIESYHMGQSPVDSFIGSKRMSLTRGK